MGSVACVWGAGARGVGSGGGAEAADRGEGAFDAARVAAQVADLRTQHAYDAKALERLLRENRHLGLANAGGERPSAGESVLHSPTGQSVLVLFAELMERDGNVLTVLLQNKTSLLFSRLQSHAGWKSLHSKSDIGTVLIIALECHGLKVGDDGSISGGGCTVLAKV